MNTPKHNCSRCGSPLRPGGLTCLRCGSSNIAFRPPSLGQCSDCRANIPLGSAFCPSCGKSNRQNGPSTSNEFNRNVVSVDNTTLILQTISVISSILFTIYLHSQGADRAWNAYAVALVPTILVFAPQIGGALFFKGHTDDARLALIACTSGLLIGLRAVSVFLLDSQIPDNGTLAGAMFTGLAGFGVIATTFPRNMQTHRWIADDWKNIRILWGVIAALFLIQSRNDLFGELMVFTAASIAGGSSTEIIEVFLLLILPFVRAPHRQSAALTLGVFSFASWGGNMIMSSNQLAWRPNPVITLCCIGLIVPWKELLSSEKTRF